MALDVWRAAISNPQFHESKNLREICYRILGEIKICGLLFRILM